MIKVFTEKYFPSDMNLYYDLTSLVFLKFRNNELQLRITAARMSGQYYLLYSWRYDKEGDTTLFSL